jgi:hypothetical protein
MVAGLGLSLLALAGCQSIPGSSTFTGTPSEPVLPAGRFHDVPVPSTFRLIPDKTFIFENPALKAGILTYKGKLSVTDTVNFFKEQMPANGWTLISTFEVKDVILKFEKIGWTCDITVRPGFEREIIIKIGPTAEGPAPPIPPPPST